MIQNQKTKYQIEETKRIKRRKKNIKKYEKIMRCPICGAPVKYRSADGVFRTSGRFIFACSEYENGCDTYIIANPDGTPAGTMADRKTRRMRQEAHYYLNQLYTYKDMTKSETYEWLAEKLQIPKSKCHIRYFDTALCQKVIEVSKTYLGKNYRNDSFVQCLIAASYSTRALLTAAQ